MANLDKIVEDLSKLTVMEASQLSRLLEETWGVSAASAPAAVAAVAAGEAAEVQTEFNVILTRLVLTRLEKFALLPDWGDRFKVVLKAPKSC